MKLVAYRVFETMNDRGLSLTPTEMLAPELSLIPAKRNTFCGSVPVTLLYKSRSLIFLAFISRDLIQLSILFIFSSLVFSFLARLFFNFK